MAYKKRMNGRTLTVTRYPWSDKDRAKLIELFEAEVPLGEIAVRMRRSVDSVRCRLVGLRKAGLVGRRRDATRGENAPNKGE